jgi:nucleoside phosphorylase
MDLQSAISMMVIVFLCRMYCLDVGRLKETSTNTIPNHYPETNSSKVLIITVNDYESQAVLTAFETAAQQPARPLTIADRVYQDLGMVNDSHVFMATSEKGSQGSGGSQQATQKAITALQPHAVFAVGIAFGIDERKQKIGDILVSGQLTLYELQRAGQKEIVLSWLSRLTRLLKPEQSVATHPRKAKIIPINSLRGDRPHSSSALISFLNSAKLTWRKNEKNAEVRFGLLLSGEKLVDNLDYRDSLREQEPEAIGGEMEGAGVYTSCHDAKVDWIVVKAICDWADGNKGQDKIQRQPLAAKNAADFIVHALQHTTLPRTHIPSDIVTPVAKKTK